MRKCRTCCLELDISIFGKDKYTYDGFKTVCKNCEREKRYKKEGREVPEKVNIFLDNGYKLCAKCNEYREPTLFYVEKSSKLSSYCKECNNKSCKERYDPNIAKIRNKNYYESHKEELNKFSKDWGIQNKERISKNKREYYNKNKEVIGTKKAERYKNKYNSDPLFRMKENFRRSILKALKSTSKSKRTFDILGLSMNDFKKHIESHFLPWMNWENYGLYNGELNYGWDLDHIIPISSATTEEEVYLLNHWSNFQPLCSKVNRDIKKDKI